MTLTIGDLLKIPEAVNQHLEYKSQQRANQFVAKLFNEPYDPLFGIGYGSLENNSQPYLAQNLAEFIDPALIKKE